MNSTIQKTNWRVSTSDALQSEVQKKELLLARLERKLGKSRNEVKKIVSESLLSLLAQVPFNG